MEKRNRTLPAAGMILAGGIVGAGIALLFAPQSGRRTRRKLRHLGRKALNKSASIGLDVRHSFENLVDDMSQKFRDGLSRTRKGGHDMRKFHGNAKFTLPGKMGRIGRAS
jgi:gas vesicle protein